MLTEEQKSRIKEFEAPIKMDYERRVFAPTMNAAMVADGDGEENAAFRAFLLEKPENAQELSGLSFAVLATDGVEELELIVPYKFFAERGAKVQLVAPRYEKFPKKMGLEMPEDLRETHIMTARFTETAGWFPIDKFVDEAAVGEYDALVIAGGAWNPDSLRQNKDVLKFVKNFVESGKPVGAICHAPWVLVSAGILQGKNVTGNWAIFDDLKNAGANVSDEAVVINKNIITSRYPYDLPQFLRAVVANMKKADSGGFTTSANH